MHHGGAFRGEQLDLLIRQIVHVHRYQSLVHSAKPLQVRERSTLLLAHVATLRVLVSRLAVLHLRICLVEVDVQGHVQLLAQAHALGYRRIGASVGGMQCHSPRDARLVGEQLSGLLALGEVLVRPTAVAAEGELDGDDAQGSADPRLRHGLADGLGIPIHVVKRRRASLEHLGDRKVRSVLHELVIHELELQRPDRAFEPLAQRDVIGHTP
mmetsp:Transcript_21079/g.60952  ORF Transcript_21079/g.60952 Transcript_21079/m.60952 type:complete len:212 (-) Transcript_21079:971-1606(-)